MLEPGRHIERYIVETLLGEGGVAEVYRVRHDTLDTRHALKVLTGSNRGIKQRLLQEGRVQASLRHANIVAVTDVLEVDGNPALLLEYIEGPSLDQWLVGYRPTIPIALAVFRGIAAAVRFAHDRGVIHRDLKPSNVLMQLQGNRVIPKVADFGLAKALDNGPSLKRTRTGATLGTPAYMAPEQIRDASTVDARADVYSLGCILYELVCGRPPYDGPDIMTLFAQVATGDYPDPRTLCPTVPDGVVAAIAGALKVDPTQRLSHCDSLLELVDRDSTGADDFIDGDATAALRVQDLVERRRSLERSVPKSHLESSPPPTWSDSLVLEEPPLRKSTATSVEVTDTQARRIRGAPLALAGVGALGALTAAAFLGLLVVLGAFVAYGRLARDVAASPSVIPQEPPVTTVAEVEPPAVAATPSTAPIETAGEPDLSEAPPPRPRPPQKEPTKPATPTIVEPTPEPAAKIPVVHVDLLVDGEVSEVRVVGATGTYAVPGEIPPGSYDIEAKFPEVDRIRAGTIVVVDDQPSTVKCVQSAQRCAKR